jgi:signal transduction histidine kinase
LSTSLTSDVVREPIEPSDSVEASFAADTLLSLRWRCAATSGIYLLFVAMAVWIEAETHPERLETALGFYAAEAATCAIALVFVWFARSSRSVVAISAGLSCALLLYLVGYAAVVDLERDVLAMALLCWVTVVGILMPWGGLAQAVVSMCALTGYVVVPRTATPGAHPLYAQLALLATATASILGASLLHRYRRAAFEHAAHLALTSRAEQEKTAALRVLLEVHHVLARDDGSRRVLDDIARLAKDALGCDFVNVYVFDAKRDAYLLGAGHGQRPELMAELERVEWVRTGLPLGREFRPDRQIEIPDVSQQSLVPPSIMQHFDIASVLYAPISRSEALAGLLAVGHRSRTGPFAPRVRELAQAIADALGVALENRQLIADLTVASRLKSEFVATMSHELRTPLNAILGYTDLLVDGSFGPVPSEQHEMLERILRSAKQLNELVAATLDLSRLESGREIVSVGRVDLLEVLQSVERALEGMRRPGGAELRWTNRAGTPAVYGDGTKIKTILRNLVSNGIKFTPTGTVEIIVDHRDDALLLEVRDTGIGIPESDLELIFEMFRQGNASTTRTFEGVGLGLFIAKSLVTLLGGSIEVSSTQGVGSTFRVRIPAQAASAEADPQQPAS